MPKIIKAKSKFFIPLVAVLLLLFSAFVAWAAALTSWDFTDSAKYTYDSNKVEFSSGQAQLKSDFFNTSWSYRQTIEVVNAGSALTNYQVKITISTSDASFWSHVNADGSDVRFTDSDKTTLLSYFIETFEASPVYQAIFWVKMPTVAAGTNQIYLYYGNAGATSTSSGESTFIVFDHFLGSSLNSSIWAYSATGSYLAYNSVSNSLLHLHYGSVYSLASFETSTQNRIMEMKTCWVTTLEYQAGFTVSGRNVNYPSNSSADALSITMPKAYSAADPTWHIKMFLCNGTTTSYPKNQIIYRNPTKNYFYTIGTEFRGSTYMSNFVLNSYGSELGRGTYTYSWDRPYYMFMGYYLGNNYTYRNVHLDEMYIDWVRVRQYATPEPTVTVNTAESYIYPIDNPTLQPLTTEAQNFVSLAYFGETATKNDGEIKYMLSNDAGSSWLYWNSSSSSWETSNQSYSQANTATEINAQVSSFPRGSMRFLFKAFLHSSGLQNVQLDAVTISGESMAISSAIHLTAQPTAGASAASMKASFYDPAPNLNNFFVALNGGNYGTATAGDSGTSDPATLEVAAGATLTGFDCITKIKCEHTNISGEAITSESTTTAESWYVKPYTPPAPTLSILTNTSISATINKNSNEHDNVEYALYEATQGKYVQSTGTLGATSVFKTRANWGYTVEITGLSPPVSTYQFSVIARNPNNSAGTTTSEVGAAASISNVPPIAGYTQDYYVPASQVLQSGDGDGKVTINFRIKDYQSSVCTLESFAYSTNEGTSWVAPTSGDISGALGGMWPNHSGAGFTTEASFSGAIYSFTFNTKHSDIIGFTDAYTSGAKIRFKASNGTTSSLSYATTDAFAVDNSTPAKLVTAELTSRPQAGDTAVSVYGTFTELYPLTNLFYAALNGGDYGSATAGESGTTAPTTQEVTVATLTGADYISKIKIVETDIYGNAGTNENTSPEAAYKYVKPYTPYTPLVTNPTASTVRVTISPHENENSSVVYCIYNTNEAQYVQSTGSLGTTQVWQTASTWGTITVEGLSNPITDGFKVKAKNPYDPSGTALSEWSPTGEASNAPPTGGYAFDFYLSSTQEVQSTNGSGILTISFKIKDPQAQSCSLEHFEYSTNGGESWQTPTNGDASPALSGGWPNNSGTRYSSTTNFSSAETHSFTLNTQHAEISGFGGAYISNAKIRFLINDGTDSSIRATTSDAFVVDNLAPAKLLTVEVITTPEAGATTASLYGTFTEINPATNMFFAALNGGTYGSGVSGEGSTTSPATKEVTVATLDGNDYISGIKIVETDTFGNVGTNENTSASATWYVKPYTPRPPTLANPTLSTVQLTINAHTSETSAVEYAIYDVNQAKYVQSTGTLDSTAVFKTKSSWETGGVVTITNLTNSLDDFMVIARNPNNISIFSNWGPAAHAANIPPIGGNTTDYSILASKISQSTDGSGLLTIYFKAKSARQASCSLESFAYSTNEGVSWAAPTGGDASASLSGNWPTNGGARFNSATDFSGTEYSFTFNTKHADVIGFSGARITNAKIRFLLNDGIDNSSQYTTSESFIVDNLSPSPLIVADLTTTPEAGTQEVSVYGTFSKVNPATNTFYIALSGEAYGSGVAGESSTTTPATCEIPTGRVLNGNDYVYQIKIVEVDTLGNIGTNENTAPSAIYKYVKPYTPSTPTVTNATASTVDIIVNPNANESPYVTYSIYNQTADKYVQSGGTPGDSPTYQTAATWGTITATSVSDPLNAYFQIRAKNPNSTNTLSEFSPRANASNTPPIGGYTQNYYIPASQETQSTNGSGIITINFRAKDAQQQFCSLEGFVYSTDGTTWLTPANGDTSAALSGGWPNNSGSGYTSATDFSGTLYSFTLNTQHADVRELNNAYNNQVKFGFLLNDSVNSSTQITTTAAMAVDNLLPAKLATAEITTPPLAGATAVSVYGTFTEHNPSSNIYYVALNGGSYGSATTGESGTATPATKEVTTSTLNGDDYISKIKIVATDAFGNVGTNENTSPETTCKYVKPYTPLTSTVNNATASTVNFTINAHADESNLVEYAIYDSYVSKYVQSTGTLDATATWQTKEAWGTVTVSGLTAPLSHSFKVKSRNPNDASGNTVSDWGPDASAANTPPVGGYANNYYIPASQVSQSTNGAGIITINFRAKDAQEQSCSLESFAYSIDGSTWYAPLNGDASSALSGGWPNNNGERYTSATDFSGTVHSFTFNTKHADISGLANTYKATVKTRFILNDGTDSSTQVTTTAAFTVDNLIPAALTTANLTASLEAGDTVIRVYGTFTEINPSTNLFYAGISGQDYGSATTGESSTSSPVTCEVAVSPLNGADYISKVKIVATDYYGNVGTNENTAPSTTYKYVKPYTPMTPTVNNPTVSTVDVAINPHISESSSVEYAVYNATTSQYVQSNGSLGPNPAFKTAANWATVTVSGVASPLYTDFKVRSRNPYDSSGNTLSNWSPTANARNTPPTGGYTNDYYIPASQVSQSTDGLGVITINTRIKDAQRHISSLESFAYSIDGGSRWYTPMNEDQSASLSGSWPNNHGQGLSSEADFSGPVYSFTFDTRHADVAGFNNSYKNNVKIRFLVNDGIDSSTTVTTTAAFAVDDLSPARSTTVEVVSQPQAGSTTIRACGSFTEVNPASNLFYVGISGMDYGSSTSGEGGTASPATCEVNVNTLDGNDYISKIKIIATDYYGNQGNNENTSPAATYKYVKPYTPQRPDATNPTLDSVEITVRKATAEADNLEYCIYATREDVAAQYVQADGLLGDTPVWQTISNWGTDGTITVWPTILPATYYTFQAKSRNSSDTAHQSSSESNFSEGVRGSSSSTPEVISYSPTADAIGVDLMPPITAVFSEKMLSDSIGFATSLTAIRDNSGNTISISVTGEVSYNTETKTASFVPAESLLYGYTYTFRIDTLATNLVGTPLPSVFSINFSTICSSDESNTTISTDGIVWLIAPSGTLPQNGYFRINRDPVHSPTLVDPAEITAANEKAIAEGNPYHYPIESTITENIAYATAESVISDLNRNVTIRIYYTDNNEDGFVDGTSPQIRARDLLIYRLNETSALWVRVPTSVVNTSDHYVYASVPRLGTYVIMSTPATDASNAYAYPVPFKPSAGHTTITFTNLPAICTIKIYTIAGELVKTISVNSSSGQTTWDGKTNFGGNTASGVYLYLIESSSSKKTGKLIIIR